LLAFVDDPRPQTGEAARAWVEQVADPHRYASRLAGLYHQLLTCPAARATAAVS
jgi:hypothetical protein